MTAAAGTAGTLLLVDDEPVFRQVLATALRRRGFEVATAGDVREAQAALSELVPTHAVIDLKLPDGSGLDLVAPLRARNAQARIVVLSGYASIPTAIDAIKLGATYYLAKPVDADVLMRAFDAGERVPVTHIDPPPPTPSVRRVEWEHIQRVLVDHGGNISAAARALRMHRRTLQRKLGKRSGSV
jgi:two-component system response regulator RegA